MTERKETRRAPRLEGRRNAPRLPLPAPLCGSEEGTFTHYTITQRFKRIAQRLRAENPGTAGTQRKIEELLAEIPYHVLRPINDPLAPDHLAWQGYLRPYLHMNWLQAPWFVVETYFFRRLLEATGYYQPGRWYKEDPYRLQKRLAMAQVPQGLRSLALSEGFLAETPPPAESISSQLAHLFRLAVWSNQADLSMWPAGDQNRPLAPPLAQLSAPLLVDHAHRAGDHLSTLQRGAGRVDFILDNVGLELAIDLIIADYLLRNALAACVVFHVKPHPTYVSDAIQEDVHEMVNALTQMAASSSDLALLAPLRTRLASYLHEERLKLTTHYFWTSPLSGWEMPQDLFDVLAQSHLIISKGDANYRRWVGDRHWPFTTPLEEVLAYVPAPLLALRVLKAEVVIGLQPGQAEEMFARDAQWMFNGRWGVIQYVRP